MRRGSLGRLGFWAAVATLVLSLAPPNAITRGQRATGSAPAGGASTNSTEEDHVSGVGSEEVHASSRARHKAARARRPLHGGRRIAVRRVVVQHFAPPVVSNRRPRANEPRFTVPRWDDDPPARA